MKVSISYPPLESQKGAACLTQNRQFQWLAHPTYIYPVIPATAATLLKNNGHEVFWDDAIAEELTYNQWKERILKENPDVIAVETKTPVVKMHWEIINELKNLTPSPSPYKGEGSRWNPKIVLIGDHVTALPEESLQNSKVDYVLASGDYDFMLLNLVNHLTMGEKLEGGFWFRNNLGEIVNSGLSDISQHDLNTLPIIDRELTRWELYSAKNGNFKHNPGAYMMSARDCWWGRCTFCSWTTFFPGSHFRTMSPQRAIAEVENLINLGVKEIMEDSGTLPIGSWLKDFCNEMISRGYNKRIKIGCNMRLNAVGDIKIWRLMRKAGFRLILFGLESANQETLDKINKNLKVEEIEPTLKMCKEAGLEPHITTMIGYPWETRAMAEKTLNLAKELFKKGYIDTLQATIVVPYPGTPLYKYCQENDLLLTTGYERFDQREAVIKSPLGNEEIKKLVQGIYKSVITPKFIVRKIISIHSIDDIKFLSISFWKWLGKIMDFSGNK